MPRYIAFLRAVNVGGRTVRMEDLRALFEEMGFGNVETFIASGNVIFDARAARPEALERKVEAALRQALGHEVTTFVRSRAELAAVAAFQPFSDAALQAAQALNVGFLKEPLDSAAHDALMALRTDIDDFRVEGREVYWLCRLKQSDSTFSNVVFERKVKRATTLRGISTVRKLADKYPPG